MCKREERDVANVLSTEHKSRVAFLLNAFNAYAHFASMYVCSPRVCNAQEGQKRALSDPVELGLQTGVSCHVEGVSHKTILHQPSVL